MNERIVHCKSGKPYDRYIGRSSYGDNGRYGNPWEIGVHGTREQVIYWYSRWLRSGENFGNSTATAERREEILTHLTELEGKTLGCWCNHPFQACHGDVLITLLNEVLDKEKPLRDSILGRQLMS